MISKRKYKNSNKDKRINGEAKLDVNKTLKEMIAIIIRMTHRFAREPTSRQSSFGRYQSMSRLPNSSVKGKRDVNISSYVL